MLQTSNRLSGSVFFHPKVPHYQLLTIAPIFGESVLVNSKKLTNRPVMPPPFLSDLLNNVLRDTPQKANS
jgi:hypothetical protein